VVVLARTTLLSGDQRKLAAIMFTDMVGYTALSQRDEPSAINLLERHNELLRPVFGRHRGREVKTTGDGFLVEFDSALDAVQCAVDVQHSLYEFNLHEGEKTKALVRIGIHVGDIVRRGDDVFGDAVNLASRVRPLADPGGICISEQVFAQVRNKIPYSLVRLSPQYLKNVQFPMDIYKVILPFEHETKTETPISPKTRIAVLPFTNISPDSADEYFAEGMTEELINEISHVHQLRVIARTSVAKYKGTTKSVSEIAREIGVGSVLEGSVRKSGNRVRVTAQLVDATTEEHVWSDNYDRQLDDVFSIQSDIARSVSEALKIRLLSGEQERIRKKATESTIAYILYLKGRSALHDRTEKALNEARKFFEEAIAEDSEYARAYVGLADAFFLLGDNRFIPMREAIRKANEALTTALSLDKDLPEALTAHANLLQHEYLFAEAKGEYEHALALNPSYAQAHHWYGVCLWDMGRLDEAAKEMLRAEELDPASIVIAFNVAVAYSREGEDDETLRRVQKIREFDPTSNFAELAMAFVCLAKSDFEGAALHTEELLKRVPNDPSFLSSLGFAYGRLGRIDKAHEILEKLRQLPDDSFTKSFDLAWVYCGLNEKDEAFKYLERAFEERSLVFRALWFGNFDASIREDPRYASLIRRANLSP
jgi:adenylate cyclase